ncbi:MAG: hypothetical protein KDE27_25895 [Planctomycetes bacterium]|nr:hypothetical protein [Planctomycetota bacterium]
MHFLAWAVAVTALSLVAAYNRRFEPVFACIDVPLPGVTTLALDVGGLLLGLPAWLGPLTLIGLGYLPVALRAHGPRVRRGYRVAAGLLCALALGFYYAVQLPIDKLRDELDEQTVMTAPR